MKHIKKALPILGAAAMFAFPAAASAQASSGPQNFQANLTQQNGSGASGTAQMTLDGTQLTVEITSSGLAPGLPHAQHVHGAIGVVSSCPTPSNDKDGDGLVSTAEGQPAYGAVLTSLTISGDSSADSALAVDRFPTANADGSQTYSQTVTISQDMADNFGDLAVVQHGIDLNGNGEYDGDAKSSLDPSLPLEATIPANCGKVMGMPGGGVQTGGGGTAVESGSSSNNNLAEGAMALAGIAAIAGVGTAATKVRANRTTS